MSAATGLLMYKDLARAPPVLQRILGCDYRDGLQFSELHRSIVGFSGADLEELLQDPIIRDKIDDPDAHGMTPLLRAILRDDNDAVGTLLKHGCDPNIAASSLTPLYFAALHSNTVAAELLLDAGADECIRHFGGLMALAICACFANLAVTEVLLEWRPMHCYPIDQQNGVLVNVFYSFRYLSLWDASMIQAVTRQCWYGDASVPHEEHFQFKHLSVNALKEYSAEEYDSSDLTEDDLELYLARMNLLDKVERCRTSTRQGGPIDGIYPRDLPKCDACLADDARIEELPDDEGWTDESDEHGFGSGDDENDADEYFDAEGDNA